MAAWGKGRHSQDRSETVVRSMTPGDYVLIIKAKTKVAIPLKMQMTQKSFLSNSYHQAKRILEGVKFKRRKKEKKKKDALK